MKAMPKFGSSQLRRAGAFVACLACFAAHAQDYPSRPVRVVAPSAPGGGFDLVGRVLAQKLGEQTGQAFVVENRPGAGTDRKSTRLNSSHVKISYAVFCLKK